VPVGEGLLAFSTLRQAVEAIHTIDRDYQGHAQGARQIAEQYFDSDKVLAGMLNRIGL